MRRTLVALCATCMAVVALGGATAANAAPSPELKLTPMVMNFGTVAVGDSLAKPLTILNRTDSTLYYAGANWPNLQHPGVEYPYGIWHSDGYFPCWEIPAKSSCELTFAFTPFEVGPFGSDFDMRYTDGSDTFYSNVVPMRGVGG